MGNVRKLTTREIYQINQQRTVPEHLSRVKILLHNIRSMHNVGAIFRSADAFGIAEIILSGYTPFPPRPEISKTALGAEMHVAWTHYDGMHEALTYLNKDGYDLWGIEQTSPSRLLHEIDPAGSGPLCVVFGNEVTGIDQDLLPHINHFVEIAQFGHKHSLNVSVTAGIVLYALFEKFNRI